MRSMDRERVKDSRDSAATASFAISCFEKRCVVVSRFERWHTRAPTGPSSRKVTDSPAPSCDTIPPTLIHCYFKTAIATTSSLSHQQAP
jgi:hypothetical protein